MLDSAVARWLMESARAQGKTRDAYLEGLIKARIEYLEELKRYRPL